MCKKITIITHSASPYQVELFNAIAKIDNFDITIVYLCTKSFNRLWKRPNIYHNHVFLDSESVAYHKVQNLVHEAALVVFNYYQHPVIYKLMEYRANIQRPWCFWGERIGYHHLGFIGAWYRQWKLSVLHQSNVPIWGIGDWAINKYRQEFGEKRIYLNVPYFSDLSRFNYPESQTQEHTYSRKFLYSGSLIYRKGVDLLASAFSRLAEDFPFISLDIMGEGYLRPRLEKQLKKYSERVKFLGFQEWENLPNYYRQADVLCVPSRYDGWALVILEGLASGLPVIGTDRTGASLELISNNENGWLILSNNQEALYQAMKQATLLSNEDLNKMSYVAKKSVSNNSLEHGVKQLVAATMKTLEYFNE